MRIRHSQGEYPILESSMGEFFEKLPADSYLLSDHNVVAAWEHSFPDGPLISIEPGETSKSFETFAGVHSELATLGASRASTLVAIGGGVVGDLGGFVAATYMRGIAYIQVPTTLLAQVDSSVGGKTGIDLPEGKNLVGAFYHPKRVFLCFDALTTLPEREFVAGTAEIWKAGVIADSALFEKLEFEPLRMDSSNLCDVIRRAIEIKAAVVEEDEKETSGRRAILNFGHTIGHAIEQAMGYEGVLHGEAVAIGMVVEAKIGAALAISPSWLSERIARGLARQGLPTEIPPGIEMAALLQAMARDKKSSREGIGFSLPTELGECKLVRAVEPDLVRHVCERR